MKYAGKTFTLYASQPVAIQGSDSLYTYQNTGTGTATILGSNNAVNWTTVTTVVSGASHTGSHAYAFLMMTGSTEVSVSRGVAGDDATNQTTLQGVQGTGASYDPPTGGSGVFGWLSGIYKEIVSGTKLKLGGTDISSSNPLPVVFSTATITSRSGTITAGGTAQSFMAANTARKGWFIQNNSTGDLWVNRFGGTAIAGQPSLLIPAGALYETPDGGSGGNALSIYGATTGQTFTSAEW